jgi:malate dehydrogenase
MKRPKISIIGGGNVGATCAYLTSLKKLGDVILVDIVQDVPKGKGLDIAEATPVEQSNVTVLGTNDYADIKGSDIVVITAGLPRKPGMSRDDLLLKNASIMKEVCGHVKDNCPDAIVIVVSNPLDAMVGVAYRILGFPKNKVMGMAGILDSTRFAYFISEHTGISVENINTLVLGGHGDQMIPLVRYTNISGIPLEKFLSRDKIEKIVERTRKGGAEIVSLLKTGSAYYATASSIVEMIGAIVKDKKKILPCAAYLDKEYRVSGIFIGVPVILGNDGIEKIIEIDLDSEEKEMFEKNVAHVKELMSKIQE